MRVANVSRKWSRETGVMNVSRMWSREMWVARIKNLGRMQLGSRSE